MNSIAGFLSTILIIGISLALVAVVNRVQTQKKVLRLKIQQIRRRIDELGDINASLDSLLESTLVPRLINEEIMDLIHSVLNLDPSAEHLIDPMLSHSKEKAAAYDNGQRTHPLDRIQHSDAAIAKQQYVLSEAAKVVRRHHKIGRIQESELDAHITELMWGHLMVSVISNIAQGHIAIKRKDVSTSQSYYRKAQSLLLNTSLSDDRRQRFIREVKEMMVGSRKYERLQSYLTSSIW